MLEEIVRSEVQNAVRIAREAFPEKHIPMPAIKFSNRMTKCGGTCSYKQELYTVKFSLPIMRDNDISAFASQVAYHEVAHMVDRIVYGGWGHGRSFYHVMRVHFHKTGQEGGRTHSFKTTPTKRRKREFKYVCERCATEFNFTAIRHNNAQKSGRKAYYFHTCANGMKGSLHFSA